MIDDRKLVLPGSSPPETLKQIAGSGAAASAASGKASDEVYQALRGVGGRAWQLQAAARAADHFIRQDAPADRSTGSWLVACAVDLANAVADELDAVARHLKDRPSDAALSGALQALRARAHKLHAAVRAADHFLDQDTGEDRSTASWLVACALDLATRLATELDDQASVLKRGNPAGAPVAFSDVVAARKGSGAAARSVTG